MGFMNFFRRPAAELKRLPSGCFTVDQYGNMVNSTLPQNFASAVARQIGTHIVATFREARTAQLPSAEIVIRYASMKITARQMRGGAIIFLTPQPPSLQTNHPDYA